MKGELKNFPIEHDLLIKNSRFNSPFEITEENASRGVIVGKLYKVARSALTTVLSSVKNEA